MFQQIFFNVLEVSIIVSIIVCITCLFLSLIDRHYGFKWRRFLWIILAIRLLIPYTFSLPNPPINLFQNEKIFVQEGEKIYLTEYSREMSGENFSHAEAPEPEKTKNEVKPKIPSEDAFQIPFLSLLGIIWGIGLFIYLRSQHLNYQYFLNDLDASIAVTSGPKYQLLQEVCKKMKVRKIPELFINETVTTPFIIGYFKPVLFLPANQYTRKELEFIYHHECTHYKSYDLLYKLVITIAVGVHWFNPIIHYMKTLAFRDVELVCDQKMAKTLTNEEKRLYCNTLIHAASENRFRELDLSTCFLGNKKILKQRIQNVFDKNVRKRGVVPIICILGIMIICGASISCGKHVEIPKPIKKVDGQAEKFQKIVTEKRQEPVTYRLHVDPEEKEKLHLNEKFNLENYYCSETDNLRNEYRIDENNVLWEGEHVLADDVIHIVSSDYFHYNVLLYVTASGQLYGIGSNSNILFTDPLNPVTVDTPKLLMENVAYAVCGQESVTVLKRDGSVWIWGRYATAGFTYTDRIYPDSTWEGAANEYPEPICILKNAVYVTSSYDTAAAITEKGELWTWGANLYGEGAYSEVGMDMIPPGKREENVKFVWFDENTERTYIQKEDNSLWTCGRDVGKEAKTIEYGPEAVPELQNVICTAQFMPLILENQ